MQLFMNELIWKLRIFSSAKVLFPKEAYSYQIDGGLPFIATIRAIYWCLLGVFGSTQIYPDEWISYSEMHPE